METHQLVTKLHQKTYFTKAALINANIFCKSLYNIKGIACSATHSIILQLCSSSQLYGVFQCLSAHCLVFTADTFTVFVHTTPETSGT